MDIRKFLPKRPRLSGPSDTTIMQENPTGIENGQSKSIVNPEDAGYVKGETTKVNERVERVKRAHMNDLENIPLFFATSYFYILTEPDETTAKALFWTYVAARFTHTFVYSVVVVPQPARGLSWGIGYAITGYMAVRSLIYFLKA